MADQTIGRVSIKVTPDTSKFREEAKAKLDAEERRLPNLKVQIAVEMAQAAAAKLTATVKAARDATQAAVKNIQIGVDVSNIESVQAGLARLGTELDKLQQKKITVALNKDAILKEIADLTGKLSTAKLKIGYTADEASIKAAIAKIDAQLAAWKPVKHLELATDEASLIAARADMQAKLAALKPVVAQASIKVNLTDEAGIKAAIARINAELSTIRSVNIPVDLNESGLTAAKARLQAALDQFNTTVEVAPQVSDKSSALVKASLALLTRARDVEIKPVLSKGALAAFSIVSVLSGFDALKTNIQQSHHAIIDLFKDLPQIMAIVPGVLGLAGAFLSAASNVTGLVGSLVAALPILLALPGIAIGIGVMATAFADFGKVLPGVVSQFKALQPMISAAFWESAKGPINDLASSVFPLLRSGLEGTATALGGFFGSLAGALQGVLGGGVLQGWFNSLNSSIAIFTGFTAPLANIFKIFGDIGSSLLPLLAQYAGELATRFSEFMSSLTGGPGGVQAFAEQTMGAFKGIVEFILSIGNVFSGIFTAASAAGATTFQTLADHLNAFAGWLKSPEIQAGLTALFKSASMMMDNFLTAAMPALQSFLSAISGMLIAVLPQVGTVLGEVATAIGAIFNNTRAMDGLFAFIDGVLKGVSSLLPALAPIGDLIGALGPVLGTLAQSIGALFGTLAPSLTGIITALGPLITLLGTSLMSILAALEPAIQQLAAALTAALADPNLMAGITAIVNAFISLLPVLTPIISLAAQLVASLLPLVAAIFEPLATIITALLPLFPALVTMIMEVVNAVVPLIPLLLDLVMSVLGPLLPIVVQLASSLLPLLAAGFQIIGPIIQVLIAILTKVIDIIMPILVPALQILADIVSGVLTMAFEIIGKVVDAAFSFIMGVWSAFSMAFHGDFTGFWEKIKSVFSEFGGKMRQIVSDAFNKVKELALEALTALVLGIAGKVVEALQFFKDLPLKIATALLDLRRMLMQAGMDIIQGLIDGILSQFEKVKKTLGALTDLLPDWKGPATKDKTLLTPAGQSIIDGLIVGLESRYGAVRKSLAGLTSDIGGTAIQAPQVGSIGLGAMANSALAQGGSSNVLNYYAAPGSSLGSEEDLFGAIGRARAFGW